MSFCFIIEKFHSFSFADDYSIYFPISQFLRTMAGWRTMQSSWNWFFISIVTKRNYNWIWFIPIEVQKYFSHGKTLVTVDAEKAGRNSWRRNDELDDSNQVRCRWIRRELTTRSELITRGHNVNNINLRSHIKRFFYLRDRFPLSFIDVYFYDSIYGYILFLYPRRGINLLFFISMRFKAQMW